MYVCHLNTWEVKKTESRLKVTSTTLHRWFKVNLGYRKSGVWETRNKTAWGSLGVKVLACKTCPLTSKPAPAYAHAQTHTHTSYIHAYTQIIIINKRGDEKEEEEVGLYIYMNKKHYICMCKFFQELILSKIKLKHGTSSQRRQKYRP